VNGKLRKQSAAAYQNFAGRKRKRTGSTIIAASARLASQSEPCPGRTGLLEARYLAYLSCLWAEPAAAEPPVPPPPVPPAPAPAPPIPHQRPPPPPAWARANPMLAVKNMASSVPVLKVLPVMNVSSYHEPSVSNATPRFLWLGEFGLVGGWLALERSRPMFQTGSSHGFSFGRSCRLNPHVALARLDR
jgi:hypothetical protein